MRRSHPGPSVFRLPEKHALLSLSSDGAAAQSAGLYRQFCGFSEDRSERIVMPNGWASRCAAWSQPFDPAAEKDLADPIPPPVPPIPIPSGVIVSVIVMVVIAILVSVPAAAGAGDSRGVERGGQQHRDDRRRHGCKLPARNQKFPPVFVRVFRRRWLVLLRRHFLSSSIVFPIKRK